MTFNYELSYAHDHIISYYHSLVTMCSSFIVSQILPHIGWKLQFSTSLFISV